MKEHTLSIVLMKTVFALERIKNVVFGLAFSFAAFRARTIAGCYRGITVRNLYIGWFHLVWAYKGHHSEGFFNLFSCASIGMELPERRGT